MSYRHPMFPDEDIDALDYEPSADFVDYLTGSGSYENGFHQEDSFDYDAGDLRNPKSFPSYQDCAPDEIPLSKKPPRHWCYIGQIMSNATHPARIAITVKDKDGHQVLVTTKFTKGAARVDYDMFKINHTIAVLYPEQYTYKDGRFGLRLTQPRFVKVFPCTLETLLAVNAALEYETPVDCTPSCRVCGKEENPVKSRLLRCSRCLAVSYCSKECQVADWKSAHKRQCPLFKPLLEFKLSRDWADYYPDRLAFGEKEALDEKDEKRLNRVYRFDPGWKSAERAVVKPLQGSFIITSGELIWGQLGSFLDGMMTAAHDLPGPTGELDPTVPGNFRATAKNGVWKLAKVNAYGPVDTSAFYGLAQTSTDGWIAYHSSYESPLELLLLAKSVPRYPRMGHPRVRWVDWDLEDWEEPDFTHPSHMRVGRFFADLDSDTDNLGWAAAAERHARLYAAHKEEEPGHPDYEKWDRLQYYRRDNAFLVDAAKAAQVAKVLAGSSPVDTHLAAGNSSSFFSDETSAESIGCHLEGFGHTWDSACLIYSEQASALFPEEKELVGFWYDCDNYYHDCEANREHAMPPPTFEIV
ncbi:hypothetical protein C8R43DRAFT_1236591 [Mycena crocata]|nr:hypothetical protein C8R43DRAFT_1236591 [Mycena crocata]